MADSPFPPVSFDAHPSRYVHWKLDIAGDQATLQMRVDEDRPQWPGQYELKLNSYDLAVDVELADAVQRLRFEHPEVRVVQITGGYDRIFCAGANIRMLAQASHPFKVNFCKFTNETRCGIEDATANSDQVYIAALNGTASGGGYELALACKETWLIDDGNAAVSLPEVPLLGVLPGTGGLTRLTDKRKVRRDVADVFCTKAEGFRARDALKMGLVDATFPRSKWAAGCAERARVLAAAMTPNAGPGVTLPALERTENEDGWSYASVRVRVDKAGRIAHVTVLAPTDAPSRGAGTWGLRAFRELDDALLRLRFNHLDIGLLVFRAEGDPAAVIAHDAALDPTAAGNDWFAREVRLHQARVLRRLDNMSKSMFALVEPGNAFAGVLAEILFAVDRTFMLADDAGKNAITLTAVNDGRFPMHAGITRLAARFPGQAAVLADARARLGEKLDAEAVQDMQLVTATPDAIDWDDEVRIALEERRSLSPDALTGMEQNLRFGGGESCDTKIYGRLTAWQNWIFQRPNAVGERGALPMFGAPERPIFDYRRT